MVDETTDETLMLRYRDGDVTAFEALYTRHRGPLYRYFLRLATSAAVAEELFQDVWIGVIRARARYEPSARFTTWLYRMAHNRLVDEYRRTRGVVFEDGDAGSQALAEVVADDGWTEPENALARQQRARRLQQALASLPPIQREAFLLRVEGGLDPAEMAAVTGVHPETAKSRLRYALAKLRRELEADATGARPRREREA